MAGERTNRVPDSMSIEVPGFREAQARWNEGWRQRSARDRAIAADRAAWMRERLSTPAPVPNGIVTAARIPADAFVGGYFAGRQVYDTVSERGARGFVDSVMGNPDVTENPDAAAALGLALTVAPAVPMAKRGLISAVDRTISGSTMRPGFISVPGRTRVVRPSRGPSSVINSGFGDMLDDEFVQSVQVVRTPAAHTGTWLKPRMGLRTAEEVFQRAKKVILDTYANQKARDIVNKAFTTGDRSSPVVKMYDAARRDLFEAWTALELSARSRGASFMKKVNSSAMRVARATARGASEKELARSLKAPSLWAEKVAPVLSFKGIADAVSQLPGAMWRHKAMTVAALGIPTAAVAWYLSREEDKVVDTGTEDVAAKKKKFDEAYLKFTGDGARRSAMSDMNAMRAALIGAREVAAAELRSMPDRIPAVRERLGEFLGSVTNSTAFADLVADTEARYAARALRPDDYQREFRETYKNPESQAIGDDFWREIGGAP